MIASIMAKLDICRQHVGKDDHTDAVEASPVCDSVSVRLGVCLLHMSYVCRGLVCKQWLCCLVLNIKPLYVDEHWDAR